MKLLEFKADGVHGYLDFDIDFRPDVTFLAGLNGCGKTTALNMVMALLTPSIEKLKDIQFHEATLVVEKSKEIISISCSKLKGDIRLTVKTDGTLVAQSILSNDEVSFLRRDGSLNRNSINDVVKAIKRLSSPMFLSLDRRFVRSSRDEELSSYHESFVHGGYSRSRVVKDNSLDEIEALIAESLSEAKVRQSAADNKLRNDIILDSLSFVELKGEAVFPDNHTIRQLRIKQNAIKRTFDNLDVPSDEFEERYNDFFDNLENLVRRFEDRGISDLRNKDFEIDETISQIMSNWFVNQHQLKRIDTLFSKVESYQTEKNRIYARLSRFETLVNKFLKETGKVLTTNGKGRMVVKFSGVEKDLSVLSSGERQILIMLAHLVLNKRLRGDGVFIVDEPELSLHISWQDMFVDAIREASPNLQIVLATHSPSIIGGKNHMYVPLNRGY